MLSPIVFRNKVYITSLQKVGQYWQARLQSGENVISRSLGSMFSESIITSIPYMALLFSECMPGNLIPAATKVFLSIFLIFSSIWDHLTGAQSRSNSQMKSTYLICLKSLTAPQFMTVNWVSQVLNCLRSRVYGLLELRIQKCLYRQRVRGFTDCTSKIQRRSIFLPCRRTGWRMYFWAILGPVSMLLITSDRLSVMIISRDLAIFGGFRIHRLSSPFFSRLQNSPTNSDSWVSRLQVRIRYGVLPNTLWMVSARLCFMTMQDSNGNWLIQYFPNTSCHFSSSRAPANQIASASSMVLTTSIWLCDRLSRTMSRSETSLILQRYSQLLSDFFLMS